MTITEALAEIKTLFARADKIRGSVGPYIILDGRLKDPFEKEGGAVAWIASKRQAVADMEARVVKIRTAIQRVNLATSMTVRGKTMTVSEWLNWRREIADKQKRFLAMFASAVQQARTIGKQNARQVAGSSAETKENLENILINVNEAELATEIEEAEALVGELDGKLSLVNATTEVNLD